MSFGMFLCGLCRECYIANQITDLNRYTLIPQLHMLLPYPSHCLHLSTPSPIISYLPPISTVTDDEACEPLRLVVASPSSLPAAARLLQQLEHNQVGLLTAATHIVAISAPRGFCLHLCVGRYSSENLNQTTCQTRTHNAYD